MNASKTPQAYCIIGAGPAGLAAAVQFKKVGIPFEIIEKSDDVGGLWNSSRADRVLYDSAHMISSKKLSEFKDFPMPVEYPDYPNHRLVWNYIKDYARFHGLTSQIQFRSEVSQVIPREGGTQWEVCLANGQKKSYAGIVIATGTHHEPRLPQIPGEFEGKILHTATYRSPDLFKGQRVLVVGSGNSGCDIAVEASESASNACLSVRRGYYYIPKYALGKPSDEVGELSLKLRVPLFLRRWLNLLVLRILVGNPARYGLPKPDHELLESHPILNTKIYDALGHGDLKIKPDVQSFVGGKKVQFRDGSIEEFDVVLFATGYQLYYPFMDQAHLEWNTKKESPDFYLHLFHPHFDNLFILGMISPDSGVWWLFEEQAELIAQYLLGLKNNTKQALRLKAQKASRPHLDLGNGIQYVSSPRHSIEVEHSSYSRRIRKLARQVNPFRYGKYGWKFRILKRQSPVIPAQ